MGEVDMGWGHVKVLYGGIVVLVFKYLFFENLWEKS